MPVVQAVQHHAHAFRRCYECGDADDPEDREERAPAAACFAKRQDDGSDGREQDRGDAEAAGEGQARWVAVADYPADEVWVCLSPEGVLDALEYCAESGGVGSVGQGADDGFLLASRQVQLSGGVVDDVSGHDPVDFSSKGLNGD